MNSLRDQYTPELATNTCVKHPHFDVTQICNTPYSGKSWQTSESIANMLSIVVARLAPRFSACESLRLFKPECHFDPQILWSRSEAVNQAPKCQVARFCSRKLPKVLQCRVYASTIDICSNRFCCCGHFTTVMYSFHVHHSALQQITKEHLPSEDTIQKGYLFNTQQRIIFARASRTEIMP